MDEPGANAVQSRLLVSVAIEDLNRDDPLARLHNVCTGAEQKSATAHFMEVEIRVIRTRHMNVKFNVRHLCSKPRAAVRRVGKHT